MFRRSITAGFAALIPFFMSACSLGVYKVPVQQGNLVNEKMLSQLEPGMTQDQVRFVMGQPLVADINNKEQWLYLYQKERGAKNVKGYQVRIHFDNSGQYTHYTGSPEKKALPPTIKD